MSTVVLSMFFEISRLFGGFFATPIQIETIPEWKFADALSYIKYTYYGVALNELDGLDLQCLPGQTCKYTTGEEIEAFYGYDQYTISYCLWILVVYVIACRVLAYIGLRFVKT
jgi:ATP-binding cassette, subfamily G (WHITE), member 2